VAHSKSSRKRVRQNLKRRLRNRRRKAAAKESVRALAETIHAGKREQADQQLRDAYRQLDKTSARGASHKRSAARKKSRLARRVNQIK